MLFDLRSPKRKRTIQVVFSLLALIFVVSFVGSGIGSNANGGLFDAIFGGGGGGGNGSSAFEQDIKDAEKTLETRPNDRAALAELVTLYFQRGQSQLEVDSQTGAPRLTPDADESFNRAADNWDAYLKTKPKKPDSGPALQMVQVYFLLAQIGSPTIAEAHTNVEQAAAAQQIVVDDDASAGNLKNLAFYSYLSGRFAKADAITKRALAAAETASERGQIRQELTQGKSLGKRFNKQLAQEKKAGANGAPGTNPLEDPTGGLGGGSGALGTP